MSSRKDSVQRFLFEKSDIRGERVYLENSFEEALASHDYPGPVRELLGELVAAAVLLSTTLKYNGVMTLQAKGTGPLSLLMVECNNTNNFRALARWSGDCPDQGLHALLKEGQLVITIDPDQGQRYQGIVPLEQPTLSSCLEHYFTQSEQLATRVWLASDGVKAAGMLIQELPHTGDEDTLSERQEFWHRIIALTHTVSSDELLTIDTETLLHRLYHEDDVRLFDADPVSFQCTCSRVRSLSIIRSLGEEEVKSVIHERGHIAMDCQFCNQQYVFSPKDVSGLWL